jgi:hypothetical protein
VQFVFACEPLCRDAWRQSAGMAHPRTGTVLALIVVNTCAQKNGSCRELNKRGV